VQLNETRIVNTSSIRKQNESQPVGFKSIHVDPTGAVDSIPRKMLGSQSTQPILVGLYNDILDTQLKFSVYTVNPWIQAGPRIQAGSLWLDCRPLLKEAGPRIKTGPKYKPGFKSWLSLWVYFLNVCLLCTSRGSDSDCTNRSRGFNSRIYGNTLQIYRPITHRTGRLCKSYTVLLSRRRSVLNIEGQDYKVGFLGDGRRGSVDEVPRAQKLKRLLEMCSKFNIYCSFSITLHLYGE